MLNISHSCVTTIYSNHNVFLIHLALVFYLGLSFKNATNASSKLKWNERIFLLFKFTHLQD